MLAVFAQASKELSGVYTPRMVAGLANKAIVSVHIDGQTGRLNGGGILHWVCIVDTFEDRCGYGMVDVYNPYPNRVERYSYAEFLASARAPYGIVLL
jgi:hypothetical protein